MGKQTTEMQHLMQVSGKTDKIDAPCAHCPRLAPHITHVLCGHCMHRLSHAGRHGTPVPVLLHGIGGYNRQEAPAHSDPSANSGSTIFTQNKTTLTTVVGI